MDDMKLDAIDLQLYLILACWQSGHRWQGSFTELTIKIWPDINGGSGLNRV